MTAMTKKHQRELKRQLAALRRERQTIMMGGRQHWGMAWCAGPGSPYHETPVCEGCCGRRYCREEARKLDPEIDRIASLLAPVLQGVPVQGGLW